MLRKKFAFALLASLLLPLSGFAATFVVPPDRDMVRRADAIVVGEALASYTAIASGGWIETVTPFSIEEVIKGSFDGSVIDVHEPGGRYGDRILSIPGVPRFTPGERVILFLTRTPQGTWAVTDIALGKFTFAVDRVGQRVAIRAENEILGWGADLRPHVERRRAAEGFLQFLRTEARGGRGRDDYFVTSHPLLRIEVRSRKVETDSHTAYTATSYSSDLGGGLGSRWSDFPAVKNFYTTPGASATAVSSTTTAIAAWTNDCPSNINYVYAGTDPCNPSCKTMGLSDPDGLNTVLFERNLAGYGIPAFTCSGSGYSGTLGIGGITSVQNPHTFESQSFYTTIEVDVEMNQGTLGCALLVNSGDFGSGVTHEIGHTLGLRHSDQTRANNPSIACSTDASLECNTTNAIMKSFIPNGVNSTLSNYDKNAAVAMYPGGSCGSIQGDLNLDQKSDIIWREQGSGTNAAWYMNSFSITGVLLPSAATSLVVAGTGDFDGDGDVDIFWRNPTTGDNAMWLMNGASVASGAILPNVTASMSVAGVGDLDGNGKADVVWRNATTGENAVWLMNGTALSSGAYLPTIAPPLNIAAVDDVNGDGKADIIFRNQTSGDNAVWLMNGTAISTGVFLPNVTGGMNIVGAGDLNGDGRADILWRNAATGDNAVWFMSATGTLSSGAFLPNVTTAMILAGVGDFNGNSKYDLLWRNTTTGDNAVWLMDGSTISSGSFIPSAATSFSAVSPK